MLNRCQTDGTEGIYALSAVTFLTPTKECFNHYLVTLHFLGVPLQIRLLIENASFTILYSRHEHKAIILEIGKIFTIPLSSNSAVRSVSIYIQKIAYCSLCAVDFVSAEVAYMKEPIPRCISG